MFFLATMTNKLLIFIYLFSFYIHLYKNFCHLVRWVGLIVSGAIAVFYLLKITRESSITGSSPEPEQNSQG